MSCEAEVGAEALGRTGWGDFCPQRLLLSISLLLSGIAVWGQRTAVAVAGDQGCVWVRFVLLMLFTGLRWEEDDWGNGLRLWSWGL